MALEQRSGNRMTGVLRLGFLSLPTISTLFVVSVYYGGGMSGVNIAINQDLGRL